MANRYPLVVDSSNYRIEEIPSGDNLDLNGVGIVNLSSLATTSITVGSALTITSLGVAAGLGSTAFPVFRSGISTNTGLAIPSSKNVTISVGGTAALDVHLCQGNPSASVTNSGTYVRVDSLQIPSNYVLADNTWQTVARYPQVGVTTGPGGAIAGGGMVVAFLTNHYYAYTGYSGMWAIHFSYDGFVIGKQLLALGSWPSDSNFDVRRNPSDPTELQFKVWDSTNGLPTSARYSILTCDARAAVAGIGWSGRPSVGTLANPFGSFV